MMGLALAGALIGGGVALLVMWLAPAQPDLADALDRLDPSTGGRTAGAAVSGPNAGVRDRAGHWLQGRAPEHWVRTPASDLQLLGVSRARFLGEKATYAAIGVLFPSLFTATMAALGVALPLSVPAGGGLILGMCLSMVPDIEARRRAVAAREDFARAATAYIDLTAMERRGGGGAAQALEEAATVGDSWAFVRLRDELARARWAREAPWDALARLGDELRVPALRDIGDIMRIGGAEGGAVYDALRSRAASNRDAILAADLARANQASEALTMPVAALGLVFLVLLAAPAVLRIALGG